MAKKNKTYSLLSTRLYHFDRALNPYQNGLQPYSPKHTYSLGYYDASSGDNSDLKNVKKHSGNKGAFAYSIGYKRGLKNKISR